MQGKRERHPSPTSLLRDLSNPPHLVNPTSELEKLVGAQGPTSERQPAHRISSALLPVITFTHGQFSDTRLSRGLVELVLLDQATYRHGVGNCQKPPALGWGGEQSFSLRPHHLPSSLVHPHPHFQHCPKADPHKRCLPSLVTCCGLLSESLSTSKHIHLLCHSQQI